ncbi:hypothetical protein P1S61_34695, partial [Streptomyces sp. ME08-AFT2]|uniref:hypothetical protein n=1 Tax=Streptomyces sp. ME08-AFT2 TaxID=3028683 RepID=UPI0029BC3D3E
SWELPMFCGPGWPVVKLNQLDEKPPHLCGGVVTCPWIGASVGRTGQAKGSVTVVWSAEPALSWHLTGHQ